MTTEVRTQTSEQAEGVSSLSGRCLTNEGYGCILCFRCGHCAFRGELGGSYGKKKKATKSWKSYKLLTHMTLLGEPMDEPGGEMEASDRRLCCEVQRERGRGGDCTLWGNDSLHLISNIFISKLALTLSLLSALAACLHNGCHTSQPEED